MPRFTKGPWSRNIKPARKYNTIFAGRNTHVCHLTVTGLTDEEIEGNCDLIKAAPTLYDALEFALLELSNMTTTQFSLGKDKAIRDRIREALAEAAGVDHAPKEI